MIARLCMSCIKLDIYWSSPQLPTQCHTVALRCSTLFCRSAAFIINDYPQGCFAGPNHEYQLLFHNCQNCIFFSSTLHYCPSQLSESSLEFAAIGPKRHSTESLYRSKKRNARQGVPLSAPVRIPVPFDNWILLELHW